MTKENFAHLNVVTEGKPAWLTYEQYYTLKRLFEAVPLPANSGINISSDYLELHRFLSHDAGLALPLDERAIHYNAFVLIRRGYKPETITPDEYKELKELMVGLEIPTPDDMELAEFGDHRTLYLFLVREMGLSVAKGRGPAWHRANDLIKAYEAQEKPVSD